MSDSSIVTICGTIVTVVTLIVGYLKLKYEMDQKTKAIRNDTSYIATKTDKLSDKTEIVEKKIDANTVVTVKGNQEATKNAAVAAIAANEAAEHAKEVKAKLNGGVDDAIAKGLAPIQKSLDEHARTDEENMRLVEKQVKDLEDYVHKRNHDILDAISGMSNRVTALTLTMQKIEEKLGVK